MFNLLEKVYDVPLGIRLLNKFSFFKNMSDKWKNYGYALEHFWIVMEKCHGPLFQVSVQRVAVDVLVLLELPLGA